MKRRRRFLSGNRLGVGQGLQLWLDAADTSTIVESSGSVSQWNDKSGNGNNVTQGTGSAQPTTGVTTLNGKNVINWDGGDGLIIPSGLYSIPNGAHTIFMVAKRNTETGALQALLSMNDGASTEVFFTYGTAAGTIVFRNGTGGAATKTGATNTNFQIIRARRSGTTNAITFNGNTEATNSNATDVPGIDAAAIGSVPTAVNLIGSMAEILIYNRSLPTAEIRIIETYLSNKWGVTLS